MELEVTWSRATRVWWSYLWRNIIAIVVSMVLAGILGFILGAVMAALGASTETTKIIVMPITGILGLAISVVPMKMILGKDFGAYRLVLVATQNGNNP